MGQESEAHFDDVAVFALHKPILLMGAGARNPIMDTGFRETQGIF
jgi:hypothetical protein